jgi:KUP system potassium uptake protein
LATDLRTLQDIDLDRLPRTPGTGVFLYPLGEVDLGAFVRFIARQRALPERVLLVRVVTSHDAHVPPERQAQSSPLGRGLFLTTIRFGLADRPDVPAALAASGETLAEEPPVTWFVGDERLGPETLRALSAWQRWLFSLMLRGGAPAARWYGLPEGRTSKT